MTEGVQESLHKNNLRDRDMECDHIYGIYFFQIIVPKSQGTHLDLYRIVFNFLSLRIVAFHFSSLVSFLF